MDRDRLIARHPTLYHTADARNWESIRRLGLLSTSALLDRFAVAAPIREALESDHRPCSVPIPPEGPDPALGVAWVRDQHPLDPAALAGCLEGIDPAGWRRLLNARVFFWPTEDRLSRMLRAYARQEQAIFEVDAARLLDRHGERVELSRINSGFASPKWPAARRGPSTFAPLAEFVDPPKAEIAELTVLGGVPDIFEVTSRVTLRQAGRPDRVIWPE